jgi:hypothetical protein
MRLSENALILEARWRHKLLLYPIPWLAAIQARVPHSLSTYGLKPVPFTG